MCCWFLSSFMNIQANIVVVEYDEFILTISGCDWFWTKRVQLKLSSGTKSKTRSHGTIFRNMNNNKLFIHNQLYFEKLTLTHIIVVLVLFLSYKYFCQMTIIYCVQVTPTPTNINCLLGPWWIWYSNIICM